MQIYGDTVLADVYVSKLRVGENFVTAVDIKAQKESLGHEIC